MTSLAEALPNDSGGSFFTLGIISAGRENQADRPRAALYQAGEQHLS
nr:MAG TPA: hypothetical protein [Caudoviricetes sp.]